MRKSLLALASSAALLPVTPVEAGHVTYDCQLSAASVAPVSGFATYVGTVEGYVIGAPTESVGIRCYVRAGGSVVTATDTARGIGVAAAFGVVTFSTTSSDVWICAVAFHSHGSSEKCHR